MRREKEENEYESYERLGTCLTLWEKRKKGTNVCETFTWVISLCMCMSDEGGRKRN